MSNIIDLELISIANNDNILIDSVKPFVVNTFLIKKNHHILWHIFHSFSVLYPEYPNEQQQNHTKSFISQIKSNLFLMCSSCNKTKDTFIDTYNLDFAVSSRDNLIQFFCDYHIEINTKYRPQVYSYKPEIYNRQYIIDKYTNNDFIGLIETNYDINLFKLFQINQLNLFFTKFNLIKKKILNEQYSFKFDFY